MKLELKIGDKIKNVELLEKKDDFIKIKIDDKIYELDAIRTSSNIYSLIYNNKSYNLEFSKKQKNYTVHFENSSFDYKIIDAQEKYNANRQGGAEEDSNVISTPMPGAVVKILVKVGDKVKEGDIIIVVEAMKMQSEYKASGNKIVKKILVKEGENIAGDQPLVILE